MHAYFAVRGIKHQLDRWENDLAATYYPHELNEENAKKFGSKVGMLQTSVRPFRFYEIVVPEKAMPSLLRKIQPTNNTWNKMYNKYLAIIRKALRLKKVDCKKIPRRITSDVMCCDGVHPVLIGTKKDRYVDGQEQI